jgi:hypothetical protein
MGAVLPKQHLLLGRRIQTKSHHGIIRARYDSQGGARSHNRFVPSPQDRYLFRGSA